MKKSHISYFSLNKFIPSVYPISNQMSKIRQILLKGMSGDEKLASVSKYARLLVEMGKRDPDIRALAVKIISSCQGKDYRCEQ